MIISYEKQRNGSYLFKGGPAYKRVFYGFTLAECKRAYMQAIREKGYTGPVEFIRL